jgi:threonine dehydrogenase-like Zn-dependent dehydrogenase
VLLEPTSVVAKAWEHVERIGKRAEWSPRRVLVTGAGPVGLLAAMLGVQRGLEVHVLDRATDGPKPALVRDLGATYHSEGLQEMSDHADIVLECTGVGSVIFDLMAHSTPDRIACLVGVCSGGRSLRVDPASINNAMVLDNGVVFGSVNANRRHYEAAARALAEADKDWLGRLITRKVPIDRWHEALERRKGDVKAVITLHE